MTLVSLLIRWELKNSIVMFRLLAQTRLEQVESTAALSTPIVLSPGITCSTASCLRRSQSFANLTTFSRGWDAPDSFGKTTSSRCIRLKSEEAEKLHINWGPFPPLPHFGCIFFLLRDREIAALEAKCWSWSNQSGTKSLSFQAGCLLIFSHVRVLWH